MEKTSSPKTTSWGKLGGTNAMHGWSGTGNQTPGQSSQEGSGSKSGIAPHTGPTGLAGNGQSNKSYAGTQTPGQSSSCPADGDGKFAKGGTTSMFGNRGSIPAQAGKSSP